MKRAEIYIFLGMLLVGSMLFCLDYQTGINIIVGILDITIGFAFIIGADCYSKIETETI